MPGDVGMEWSFKYNPFNSYKLIYHAAYWASIKEGKIPPPILVTLDPSNVCNFKCTYCNAAAKMRTSSDMYSDYLVSELPLFLQKWGVRAVCIAGGGEPTLHTKFSNLVDGLVDVGIQVGVVTNGTRLTKHLKALGRCEWVGVSVDAGTAKSFSSLKGVGKTAFGRVLANIKKLRGAFPSLEITYKFLGHPYNLDTIYKAVSIAKGLGCTYFHFRPAGKTWDALDCPDLFSSTDISDASTQLENARSDFEDASFRVFGVTHKFSPSWGITNSFTKCKAVGMTCVIQPDNTVGLCCDRRGDPTLNLVRFTKLEEITAVWSSEKHFEIMKNINLSRCPRCTYTPHNEIFEHFIDYDSTYKFFI